jgi:NADH-quinone oxidoreductase subunit M
VGLIRFSSFINLGELKRYVLGYFFVFLVYVTLVCCIQSDFKRLVAYSSVSHIMTIPIILFASTYVGLKGIISVMFLHGVRSPLIFILVGVLYILMSTRQHFLMRGIICFSPILSFIMVLSFFFTMSAPPFPSFVAEVFFSLSRVFL